MTTADEALRKAQIYVDGYCRCAPSLVKQQTLACIVSARESMKDVPGVPTVRDASAELALVVDEIRKRMGTTTEAWCADAPISPHILVRMVFDRHEAIMARVLNMPMRN